LIGYIDELLDLWTASPLKHYNTAPFVDHKDLYATIDSTSVGDMSWETFTLSYNGENPSDDVPKWMTSEFDEIWFCDPCCLIHNMISNPDFKDEFNYAPLQEYNLVEKHHEQNFMSGNWVWR